MELVFNPNFFALGIAVGVLGLVLLLSLVVSYAYDEPTLLFLAAYLTLMVTGLVAGQRWQMTTEMVQSLLLVTGPALVSGFLMWLFRKRNSSLLDKALIVILLLANLSLLAYFVVTGLGLVKIPAMPGLTTLVCLVWGGLLGTGFAYRSIQALETAGPWKWWLMLGHASGLVVALLFLTDVADARQAYWPVVLMLLVQIPPIYLSLVWRSRLLNESRLRSAAAGVADPLTGLSTTPVLIERLLRVMARSQQAKAGKTSNALYLIEVQNWHGLLAELGPDFNEKLLLEAAMRLRRSVGDNDMVARIAGGRFAVVAQELANDHEITSLATRLVVSGLRIDSPLLPGVELKFRVIVINLKLSAPLSLSVAQTWLDSLVSRFQSWPSSHRSRSILAIEVDDDVAEQFEVDSNY
jgi:GGDEF domain-containing protein